MSAMWETQKALYDTLSEDSTFMALINNRIYDEPPTNEQYPFVVIGESTEIRENRLNQIGYETTAIFTIYDKSGGLGTYNIKAIYDRMNTLLNMKRLSMDNYTMVICMLDNAFTARDGDKRLMNVRYRVIAH